MLVLSILIVLALVTAVTSIFVAGAQWLLVITAALVIGAFYTTMRSARGLDRGRVTTVRPNARDKSGDYLRVSVDHGVLFNPDGRHREDPDTTPPATPAQPVAPVEADPEVRRATLG
jgi:hypothetical protein